MNTRTILTLSLGLFLVAAPVYAQGAGGGSSKGMVGNALKQAMNTNGTSGPGGIQKSFMNNLQGNLQNKLGKKRGGKAYSNLQNSALSSTDATKLLNGQATKSQLKKWFGTSRGQVDEVKKSVDGAVSQKNKDGFFGMLNSIMTKDYGVDASGDFASQACGAKMTITPEQLKKLTGGNSSVKVITSIFGFGSKDDSKFMQKILNSLQSSGMGSHPMMSSLGMGGGKKGGKRDYDKDDFPKLTEGMSGFGMDEQTGGLAGGLPCDFEMPPCPFFDGSFKDLLEKCGKKDDGSTEPDDDKKGKKGKKGKKKDKDDDSGEDDSSDK